MNQTPAKVGGLAAADYEHSATVPVDATSPTPSTKNQIVTRLDCKNSQFRLRFQIRKSRFETRCPTVYDVKSIITMRSVNNG